MRQMTQQQTLSGNSPRTQPFPEAAGQTFEAGAPVVLNASGQVIEATAAGAASVVGVAAQNSNGLGPSRYLTAVGAPVTVWIANDDTLFGVAMPGAVIADVGKLVTIKKTGALWSADRTVAGSFLVWEVDLEVPGNTPYARGKFIESACQLAKAA